MTIPKYNNPFVLTMKKIGENTHLNLGQISIPI